VNSGAAPLCAAISRDFGERPEVYRNIDMPDARSYDPDQSLRK
jgi:hypothetical protein